VPDQQQGREALSVIHINVPRALKARWVRESQSAGMKLTDWMIHKLQERTMTVHKIPETLASKYHGSGHALVAVMGGQVVDLVYLDDALPDFDPDAPGALVKALADERLSPTVRRLQALGQVSMGMLSCWEFIEL
jgi:hypothetical protein